jgi:hypothetical protein
MRKRRPLAGELIVDEVERPAGIWHGLDEQGRLSSPPCGGSYVCGHRQVDHRHDGNSRWYRRGFHPTHLACARLAAAASGETVLRDIVGLYVNRPSHAVVLSVDEKSQIQAHDRTQPGMPMKKGRAGTMILHARRRAIIR